MNFQLPSMAEIALSVAIYWYYMLWGSELFGNDKHARILQKIADGIDPNVDPCDDFYQFGCRSLEGSDGWAIQLSRKIEKQVFSSLMKDIEINDTEPVKFIKQFYQTCANGSALEKQGLAPFLDIMEQVGGWPVLKENQTWNEAAFNWNRIVFKIGNASFWDNIFVPIKIHQNKTNPTQVSIMLADPTHVFFENILKDGMNDTILQNYFNSMVSLAVRMGASESYAIKEFNETLQFLVKLVNIILTGKNNSNPNLLKKRITTLELMKNYSFIPWNEYIEHQLPSNVTIADVDDKIIVYDLSYINDLKYLIESTPKRVVANFVLWKEFDLFKFFLKEPARDIKVDYKNSSIANILRESQLRGCYDYTLFLMPLVSNILYVREYVDKNTEKSVSIISNNVHNEFVELLKNASWMDEVTRNRSIDKAMSMNRIIGYPKELFNDSVTNGYFHDLQFNNENFVANVYNLIINSKKNMWKIFDPIVVKTKKQWLLYNERMLHIGAFYDPAANDLVLPASTLQDPYYDDDFPLYMKYGKVGFTFGHEIAHGFDVKRHTIDKYGNIVDWPNETKTTYNEKAQCILEQYSTYSEESAAKMSHDEDIADNSGLRAAYYAYKKLAHMDKSEKIGGKYYTPQQMFWISYANYWCGNGGEDDQVHSPNRYRVIGAVSNMKEFANDFNCPKDSKMNPSKKCRVW